MTELCPTRHGPATPIGHLFCEIVPNRGCPDRACGLIIAAMSKLRIPRPLPSADQVRAELRTLNRAQVEALAALSGVPFRSLWKCRSGETRNPGIDTVGKFYALIGQAARKPAKPAVEKPAAIAA